MAEEGLKWAYAVVKDFGFPALVAIYVLTTVRTELGRLTKELHRLVLVVVAAQGKVPPEMLKD
jgi:hypothetical protein